MDWGLYDEDGALRQGYLDADDRSEEVKNAIERLELSSDEFYALFYVSWIFHENGLEGIVLNYSEIKGAIDNRIVSDVSLMPIYQEVRNQKICIDIIREKSANKRFTMTIPFLREMHARLARDNVDPSQYRKDIPIHRTYFHEIAQPSQIENKLAEMLEYLKNGSNTAVHPIEFAANVHHRFMRVYPFTGTSGWIGRLLLNFVLLREGYLPVVIHSADRQTYYEALRGSERSFRQFLLETMDQSLSNTQKFIDTHWNREKRFA